MKTPAAALLSYPTVTLTLPALRLPGSLSFHSSQPEDKLPARYIGEASDLGWPPDLAPEAIAVVAPAYRTPILYLRTKLDAEAFTYRAPGCTDIVILRD